MRVPFLDLKSQYLTIKQEVDSAIQDVIEHTAFAGGPFVERFEQEFSEFCGSRKTTAVGSGTDALWFALRAFGIGPGDEVLTVPNTFIATCEAISLCGAKPTFVDITPDTYTMDPSLLDKAITPRTRAIIPVHIFGQTADMDPIMEIAAEKGLHVIEDACQAHGAGYKGRKAGTIGHAGCFSFYPGKNLGAYGEAGAIVSDDEDFHDRVRMLRDHGQHKKYYHQVVGWNGRMDGIQAAVLSVKLKHLEAWNQARAEKATLYDILLADNRDLVTPASHSIGRHVYHIYAIRTPKRDELLAWLQQQGIGCAIHYPVPVHLQEAYRHLELPQGSYPIAERCANEFLSLPIFPEMSEQQVQLVVRGIQEFMGA